METPPDQDSLAAALARHSLAVDQDQLDRLDAYCRALWDWNTRINLTRHTDYEKFVTRDVVDCAHLEQLLESGDRVLDLGSGGGVPGAVLAVLRPDLEVTLSESVAKKAKALTQIVATAGVAATVRHARAETLLAERDFDVVVVRAVAPLTKLLTWLAPHWDAFQRLLVFKGPSWIAERHDAREQGLLRTLELRKAAAYPLPGTESESVILSVTARASEARKHHR